MQTTKVFVHILLGVCINFSFLMRILCIVTENSTWCFGRTPVLCSLKTRSSTPRRGLSTSTPVTSTPGNWKVSSRNKIIATENDDHRIWPTWQWNRLWIWISTMTGGKLLARVVKERAEIFHTFGEE